MHNIKGHQLRALVDCSGHSRGDPLPLLLAEIKTPMRSDIWVKELSHHPDRVLVDKIVEGLTDGFRLGFDPRRVILVEKEGNMLSAAEHPDIISEYLAGELEMGHITKAGTAHEARRMDIHCGPFGVIPKKRKFRLILNLSSPADHSVNDGIQKELANLTYVTVDEVAKVITRLGKGAELA